MELKIDVSQGQVLSQKMIQSAQILQMSAVELEVYVKELMLENPIIDIEEPVEQAPERENDLKKKFEWLDSLDEQNRYYYQQDYEQDEDKKDSWNFDPNEGEELADYLLSQLVLAELSPAEYEIAEYMVNSLDSKGYLDEAVEDICTRFSQTEETVLKVLSLLQSLEPAGVCARDLKECLMLQIRRQGIESYLVEQIVETSLDLLAKNQIAAISKKLRAPLEQVLAACDEIKKLNPKPGNSFSSRENLKYITPDVVIVKFGGYFEILLNDYRAPKITVNSYYRSLAGAEDKEVKEYVKTKIDQAEWVQNCIAQRSTTLMNVSKAILDHQKEFFDKGPGHLHPLRLVDVAETIGVHESTVSRAVRGKYLQCPWGVYPMNYFFSKSLESKGEGEQDPLTPEEVKRQILLIVEEEDKKKPFSDRIISEKLDEKGIHISRRTVAKYREELGVKDASGRKEWR